MKGEKDDRALIKEKKNKYKPNISIIYSSK